MKNIHVLTFILLFAGTLSVSGQLAVGYNSDGNTLSLSTNPINKLWGEFRVNPKSYSQAPWSYSDKGITQAYVLTKIFNTRNIDFYAGGGIGANLLSEDDSKWMSINIPMGIRLLPFEKFSELYLTAEYNPMLIIEEDVPIIHTVSVGVRILLIKGE
ncbi:MAG TPA: hypothetical protein PLN06_03435 [Bacteroidales bacterium]|nr:hypothetical protein [Bacteroidales bacterium]HOU95659.1 hypothetical protein [Bacteroidales bacterium]HQG36016.1 hypothetical protein [Bacteroidales bacterium]HQG53178.1 hypothetical protein [Bacteroidales bacterium]HQJ20332.1 hypothetical protein [Bacteroidales bacterium]